MLVTDRVDGCLIEAGPDSFLTEKPWAADLCRKIGLGDQLIGSNDADRKTYILRPRDQLVVMPDGLMFMVPTKILPTVLSPLFSLRTKMRMAAEWFHPPHKAEPTKRWPRWSSATTDRRWSTCSPIRCSPESMEAKRRNLSVRAVLPRFADMESKHGSLGRAMLAARRKMAAAAKVPAQPLFTSLKDGMQQMVDALVARLIRAALKTSSPVQSVIRQDNGWTVSAGYQTDQFDAVIIATPAHAAAAVLQAADGNLSRELGEINYSSSVTVTLGYDEKVRRSLPPGFGFLVPRSAGRRMLAATFVHNKFPHRAPENRAIVRCFLGGARDEQILLSTDGEILQHRAAGTARRSSGSKPNPFLPAFTNGNPRWRNIQSAISNACNGSSRCARNFPAWLLPAMAIAALEFRTASVPEQKAPARSSRKWECGQPPEHLGELQQSYVGRATLGWFGSSALQLLQLPP